MRQNLRIAVALFVVSSLLYALFSYGGVRSPDSEIVFRTGESIAAGRGFAVAGELEVWPGFGLAKGTGGREYSVFGPGESIALVPFIRLANGLEATGWYASRPIPLSHYYGDGLQSYLDGRRPADLRPHAVRYIGSFFNVLVSAAGVAIFWLIARRLTSSEPAALAVSLLYAFGSLTWPYAGTLFSEPLATTLALLALFCLMRPGDDPVGGRLSSRAALLAGLALGASICTHITAILFVPFFGVIAALERGDGRLPRLRILPGGAFTCGLGLMFLLLGYYNQVRFGGILETGRTADMQRFIQNGYGYFVPPWRGLYGLLLGGGKGILIFNPAVLVGLAAWRTAHRRAPILFLAIAGAAITRLLFIASRSDWHGGYSLGPRYLIMLIPFLLLPIVPWLEAQLSAQRREWLALFSFVAFFCVAEQLYLGLGEIFSYYHQLRMDLEGVRHIDIFDHDRLYLDWSLSPLRDLLTGHRGPYLLRAIPLSNILLWDLSVALAGVAALSHFKWLMRKAGIEAADARGVQG